MKVSVPNQRMCFTPILIVFLLVLSPVHSFARDLKSLTLCGETCQCFQQCDQLNQPFQGCYDFCDGTAPIPDPHLLECDAKCQKEIALTFVKAGEIIRTFAAIPSGSKGTLPILGRQLDEPEDEPTTLPPITPDDIIPIIETLLSPVEEGGADANGDGRISKEELEAFIDRAVNLLIDNELGFWARQLARRLWRNKELSDLDHDYIDIYNAILLLYLDAMRFFELYFEDGFSGQEYVDFWMLIDGACGDEPDFEITEEELQCFADSLEGELQELFRRIIERIKEILELEEEFRTRNSFTQTNLGGSANSGGSVVSE